MSRRAVAKATQHRPKPVASKQAQDKHGARTTQVEQLRTSPLPWPHKAHWIALACVAIALRLIDLDHIPGINGDEAWAGVKIREFLQGHRDTWMLTTPTHRLIPLLAGLTLLCESLGRPTLMLMRTPGAICGVALVVAGFFAARRVFRWETAAWSVATLIACLPMHIAYTRLTGADMFVGLGTLALVYCVLRGHWMAAILVGAFVSLLVHPIIALLAPAPALLVCYGVLPKWQAPKRTKVAVLGPASGVLGIAGLVLFQRYAGRTSHLALSEVLSVTNFCKFWVTLGDALSGGSSYLYFTAQMPRGAGIFFSLLGLAMLGLVAYAALHLWKKKTIPVPHRIFSACCLGSAVMFYAVSPLQNNGIERYCLFLLVPMLFALGLLAQHGRFSARTIIVATTLFAWVSVSGFYIFLMRPMKAGASSHETYSTNTPEPKAAAVAWINQDAREAGITGRTAVIADSWWLYWPLAYLFSQSEQFHVYQAPGDGWGNDGSGYYLPHLQALRDVLVTGGYVVAFTDGRLTSALSRIPGMRVCAHQRFDDFGGKSLMEAMRICPQEAASR